MDGSHFVEVVEAAYDFQGTTAEWLRGVLHSARSLDAGMGMTATVFAYRREERRIEPISEVVVAGHAHEGLAALTTAMIAHMGPTSIRPEFHAPDQLMTTASRTWQLPEGVALEDAPQFAPARALGIRDQLGLVAMDCNGHGILMGVPLSQVMEVPPDGHLWSQVAVHLLAALRLRLLVETAPHHDDALVGEDGQVDMLGETLEDDAIETLRDAARRVIRAKGEERNDPGRALDLWRGLVDGRWSLVDHFDERERRFLVARRNDPEGPPVPGLSHRERQLMAYIALGRSNKHIAYTLGLSEATVSRHARSMLDKLGLQNREELIALIRTMM